MVLTLHSAQKSGRGVDRALGATLVCIWMRVTGTPSLKTWFIVLAV